MKKKLLTLSSAIFALGLLAGCGGGGSSAASTFSENLPQEYAREVEAISREVSENSPRDGSVTQSSNDNGGSATTDRVNVDFVRETDYKFAITLASTHGTDFAIDEEFSFDPADEVEFTGASERFAYFGYAEGELSTGWFQVNFFTDINPDLNIPEIVGPAEDVTLSASVEGPGFGAGTTFRGSLNGVEGDFTCADGCEFLLDGGVVTLVSGVTFSSYTPPELVVDTDWLAGGFWLYFIPTDDGGLSVEVGAFADGGDPFNRSNIDGLVRTATYNGEAAGIYTRTLQPYSYHEEKTNQGFFQAQINLEADFDDGTNPGSISGSLYDFVTYGGGLGRESRSRAELEIELKEAAITDGSNGGFFNGDIEGDYEGKWGGQFFGNGEDSSDHPTSTAGTFAAHGEYTDTENGRVFEESFVGAFGAHRDVPLSE